MRDFKHEFYEAIIEQFGDGRRFPAYDEDGYGYEWHAIGWPPGWGPDEQLGLSFIPDQGGKDAPQRLAQR